MGAIWMNMGVGMGVFLCVIMNVLRVEVWVFEVGDIRNNEGDFWGWGGVGEKKFVFEF